MVGQYLRCEDKGEYLKLVLCNGKKGNSYNSKSINEIKAVFSGPANSREKIKFVLVVAEGKNFCTGADLDWMQNSSNLSEEDNQNEMFELASMYFTILNFNRKIIAVTQGKVLGGGLGLISCFDQVFSEESSEFGLPEIKYGLTPGIVEPLIKYKCGEKNYASWSNSGESFDVKEALDSKLIDGVYKKSEKDEFILNLTNKLLRDGNPNKQRKISNKIEMNELYRLAAASATRRKKDFKNYK